MLIGSGSWYLSASICSSCQSGRIWKGGFGRIGSFVFTSLLPGSVFFPTYSRTTRETRSINRLLSRETIYRTLVLQIHLLHLLHQTIQQLRQYVFRAQNVPPKRATIQLLLSSYNHSPNHHRHATRLCRPLWIRLNPMRQRRNILGRPQNRSDAPESPRSLPVSWPPYNPHPRRPSS